jgi:transmembrane sensor
MAQRADEAASELQKALPSTWDAALVERELGALKRRLRRRQVARVALGAAAALALVVAGLSLRPPGAAPLPPSAMTLGDGSVIVPEAGAQVVVDEVSDERIRVRMQRGGASFRVAKQVKRRFIVESGVVSVTVVGTRFSVWRSGEGARVQVEEGRVRVGWGIDHQRELGPGGEGTYPDALEPPDLPATPPASPTPPTSEERAAPEEPDVGEVPRRQHSTALGWRHLARQGGFKEAYELMVADGPAGVHDDVDDLLLAADAARLSGHAARALPYLDGVLERHARDDRAPMAAFTRGRICMTLKRPAEAAESFERALVLGAQGSLQENALARAVEAYGSAGDSARAASLARTYLARYPNGRWLTSVRAYGGLE